MGKEVYALNIIASYSVIYAHSETIHKLTGADSPNVHLKNVFVTLQRSVCRVLCLFIRLKLKKAVFLFDPKPSHFLQAIRITPITPESLRVTPE